MIAVIVEDFRARAARAILSHRPEIILGRDADDAVFGKTRYLLPEIERLVVGVIDGRGQLFGRQTPFLGQQRPRMGDRLILEIITEREIAHHLEESVVPRGIADIVEIVVLAARAHAFLRRGRSRIGARLEPSSEEHTSELQSIMSNSY